MVVTWTPTWQACANQPRGAKSKWQKWGHVFYCGSVKIDKCFCRFFNCLSAFHRCWPCCHRSSMSSTVTLGAPSNCVRFAQRGIKILVSNRAAISCAKHASRDGRYEKRWKAKYSHSTVPDNVRPVLWNRHDFHWSNLTTFHVCEKVPSSESWHLAENFLCALGLTSPSRWVGHIHFKKKKLWGLERERERENYIATSQRTRNFAHLLTQPLCLCTDTSCFSSIFKYKLFSGFVGVKLQYRNNSSAEVSWPHVPVLSVWHQRNGNHPYRALQPSRPTPRWQGQWRHGWGRPRGHWSYCEKIGSL